MYAYKTIPEWYLATPPILTAPLGCASTSSTAIIISSLAHCGLRTGGGMKAGSLWLDEKLEFPDSQLYSPLRLHPPPWSWTRGESAG
ncbi:hypothetical protein CCHR01_12294 [Colletotrichum chrysophilum]|uniref:Uncharacterized protein n=1 Tax=Colletotrichum chrysophilum TaxID=1836956 RepID=A0AAD9ACW3_9PEZI|nr:hypothetical protein CCHR01_12294 [Colletotrichum chrysophilum]